MFKLILLSIIACAVVSAASLEGRIAGGKDTELGEYPYQISLRRKGKHSCGGSILNERFILTAAHCVFGQEANTKLFSVAVGSNKLNETTAVYKVDKIFRHEGFNMKENLANDIALIKTTENIKFGPNVVAVKISNEKILEGRDLLLTGWGKRKFPSFKKLPNTLQYAEFSSYDNKRCKRKLFLIAPVYESNLCAYTKKGVGACHGDSGGPLVLADTHEQVGVVSWGLPCGRGLPDVYTRLTSYSDWIAKHSTY